MTDNKLPQLLYVVSYFGSDETKKRYEFEFDYESENPELAMELFVLQLNSLVDVPVIALGIFLRQNILFAVNVNHFASQIN